MNCILILLACSLWANAQVKPTVCEAIDQRRENKGRDVKVTGWIIANRHFGFYISERQDPTMCSEHWVFSRPGLIGLRVEAGSDSAVSRQISERLVESRAGYATVEGRLLTSTVLVAPWRNQVGPAIYSPDGIVVVIHKITFHGDRRVKTR